MAANKKLGVLLVVVTGEDSFAWLYNVVMTAAAAGAALSTALFRKKRYRPEHEKQAECHLKKQTGRIRSVPSALSRRFSNS